jgi:hypothetical protein
MVWNNVSLVPRLRLGTHTFRALPGKISHFTQVREAEPPGLHSEAEPRNERKNHVYLVFREGEPERLTGNRFFRHSCGSGNPRKTSGFLSQFAPG